MSPVQISDKSYHSILIGKNPAQHPLPYSYHAEMYRPIQPRIYNRHQITTPSLFDFRNEVTDISLDSYFPQNRSP